MRITRSWSGMCAASAFSSVVFPVPVPPDTRMFCCARTAPTSRSAISGVSVPICTSSSRVYRRVNFRMVNDRARDRARREHRGHARTVLEPSVEQWLHIGDLVPTGAGDVLDGDGQVPRLERPIGDGLNCSLALDEHPPAAVVDHHLRHARVDQQILDGSQERQDAVEAAHSAPLSTWSK